MGKKQNISVTAMPKGVPAKKYCMIWGKRELYQHMQSEKIDEEFQGIGDIVLGWVEKIFL
jgi:pyridoxal/pyridoxine/pyridoxamine kinase